MAEAQAKVEIVTVDAVTNLNDLRSTISKAKSALNEMNIGSEEYRKQLVEIDKAQNLLKNAINGTTATTEDYTKALQGTTKTYNTMVKELADLKKQMRNVDISTEEGKKEFDDLSKKIKSVADELKQLDSDQGSYVRNVGNYKSAFEGWGDAMSKMPGPIGGITNGLKGVGDSMALVGKQPILGIIGLLAPLINDIVAGIKESDSAMAGVKKMMDALKPVMDFFSGILQDIVEYVGDLIGKAASFLSSSGIFQKVIEGVMGVGNAILKFVVAPFKGVVAAIKVFKEQGVKGLGDAAKAFGNEMKSGVAFKENFQAGSTLADSIVAGAKSKKPGKAVAKNIKKDLEEELLKADDLEKIWEKAVERMIRKMQEQFREEKEKDDLINEITETMDAELTAEVDAYLEGEKVMYETSVKMAQEAAEKKMAIMSAYASGTSELLGSIADLIEAQGGEDEKAVKATKNLRIAAATIDMIQGAVTAFSTAQQLGPIAGPIVGAINAAAVVASGLANIAKIRATNVSKDSSPSTPSVSEPSVQAPQLETAVPTTTVVEGASQEARLNRAASPSKVYILQSDIEAEADATKVQVAESSF